MNSDVRICSFFFFEDKRGPRAKTFGKHWSRLFLLLRIGTTNIINLDFYDMWKVSLVAEESEGFEMVCGPLRYILDNLQLMRA